MRYPSLAIALIFIVTSLGCSDSASTASPSETSSAPSTISVLTPKTLALAIGDTAQIRVAIMGSDGTRLVTASAVWASANEAVATVTTSGIVTARAPGTADITVTVAEGTATVTVSVSDKSQPLTFVGTVAGPASETGTLTLFATTLPSLSGTVYFPKLVVSLNGRLDEPTGVVDVAGGGLRFLGVVNGNALTGAYVDAAGFTGGFAAIDATHTAVTSFCGAYTSDGTTSAGNTDAGAVVLSASTEGTVVASSLPADASRGPLAFVGGKGSEAMSLVASSGETLTGQLQGETATGTFRTADGSAASFSMTSSACH